MWHRPLLHVSYLLTHTGFKNIFTLFTYSDDLRRYLQMSLHSIIWQFYLTHKLRCSHHQYCSELHELLLVCNQDCHGVSSWTKVVYSFWVTYKRFIQTKFSWGESATVRMNEAIYKERMGRRPILSYITIFSCQALYKRQNLVPKSTNRR